MTEDHEHVHEDSGRGIGSGLVIGILLIVLVIILFSVFGAGIFQGQNQNSPTLEVPDQVDVNINEGGRQ